MVNNPYYIYYHELEKAFLDTENFVAIDKINFNTYSVRYNWILQSVCSEIDTIFKILANQIGKNDCDNIHKYFTLVSEYMPALFDNTVDVVFRDITLKPFDGWKEGNRLSWWRVYNSVKHSRLKIDDLGVANYKKANQEKVINSLAALYLLENYMVIFTERDNDLGARKMLGAKSQLFVCNEWKRYYQSFMGQELFPYEEFIAKIRNNGVLV